MALNLHNHLFEAVDALLAALFGQFGPNIVLSPALEIVGLVRGLVRGLLGSIFRLLGNIR